MDSVCLGYPFDNLLIDVFVVGAALWAADIEATGTSMTDGSAPALQGSEEKDEL